MKSQSFLGYFASSSKSFLCVMLLLICLLGLGGEVNGTSTSNVCSSQGFSKLTSCSCNSTCSLYGDPHLIPFTSTKEEIVPQPTPKTTFWTILLFDLEGLTIEANVEGDYVQQIFWNGAVIADATTCNSSTTFPDKGQWVSPDYYILMQVSCALPNKKTSTSTYHLDTVVTATDYLSSTTGSIPNVQSRLATLSATSNSDPGLCITGINSDTIPTTADFQCSCSATCAAYGDPHIVIFGDDDPNDSYRVQTKSNEIYLYDTTAVKLSTNVSVSGVLDSSGRIVEILVENGQKLISYNATTMCPGKSSNDVIDIENVNFSQQSQSGTIKATSELIVEASCQLLNGEYFFNLCLIKEMTSTDNLGFMDLEKAFGSDGYCFGQNFFPQ